MVAQLSGHIWKVAVFIFGLLCCSSKSWPVCAALYFSVDFGYRIGFLGSFDGEKCFVVGFPRLCFSSKPRRRFRPQMHVWSSLHSLKSLQNIVSVLCKIIHAYFALQIQRRVSIQALYRQTRAPHSRYNILVKQPIENRGRMGEL